MTQPATTAERKTGIAHFESKWQIEEYMRALHLPVTILRPTFFMSNFRSTIEAEADGTLVVRQALRPEVRLQMIAVEDIGKFAARSPDAGGVAETIWLVLTPCIN